MPQIRVIGAEGEQLGVMTPAEAMKIATEHQLDLVEVAPGVSPPVCRIMNYSKYKYDQEKKTREARKHQRTLHVKEIKFKPNIEEHDYQVKLKQAQKFLGRGDKLKVTLTYRGREMAHQELGRRLLDKFVKDLNPIAEVEKGPIQEGRNIIILFNNK